jgi:hypothetical protein
MRTVIFRKWLIGFALLAACALRTEAPHRDCIVKELVIAPEVLPPGGTVGSLSRSHAPIVDNAIRGVYFTEGPTTHEVARYPYVDGAIRDFEEDRERNLARRRSEKLAPKEATFRSSAADQQFLLCDESLCIYRARYQEYTTMVAANMGPNMTGEALNRVIMEVDRKMTQCLAKPLVK